MCAVVHLFWGLCVFLVWKRRKSVADQNEHNNKVTDGRFLHTVVPVFCSVACKIHSLQIVGV